MTCTCIPFASLLPLLPSFLHLSLEAAYLLLYVCLKYSALLPAHVEEVTGAIHQGLTTQGNARVSEHPESKEPAYTIVSVTSTLDKFQLKIFNEEPHLVSSVPCTA